MNTIATTVIRHAKERISKCSLRHLHDRPEMTYYKCKPGYRFDATDFTLLAIDAPVDDSLGWWSFQNRAQVVMFIVMLVLGPF